MEGPRSNILHGCPTGTDFQVCGDPRRFQDERSNNLPSREGGDRRGKPAPGGSSKATGACYLAGELSKKFFPRTMNSRRLAGIFAANLTSISRALAW